MMNAPIPLRPDAGAMRQAERRSFMRAAAAAFIGHRDREDPAKVLRRSFADDAAERILKAAVAPSGTGDYPAAQANRVLPLLAPSSASGRLLALATSFDLTGYATISIPWIGASSIAPPAFIGEGAPAPMVNLTTAKSILGPCRKLLILSGFTTEMQAASVPAAETIISQALGIATERALDAALFSANAATAIAPAGLLFGLTPINRSGDERRRSGFSHVAKSGDPGAGPRRPAVQQFDF
jgi:hypothetical protein